MYFDDIISSIVVQLVKAAPFSYPPRKPLYYYGRSRTHEIFIFSFPQTAVFYSGNSIYYTILFSIKSKFKGKREKEEKGNEKKTVF